MMKLILMGCGLLVAWRIGSMLFWAGHSGEVAAGVSAPGIRQVQLGMTPDQVLAVLGRPYEFTSAKGSNTHYAATCPDMGATQVSVEVTGATDVAGLFRRVAADTAVHVCDRQDERKHDRSSTLVYTRAGGIIRNYPMLWVHFDKQSRVSNVFAKEYAIDDYCIYSLPAGPSGTLLNQEALYRLFGAGR